MAQATPAVVPRNSPCPCGSGRRYKECHGAFREAVEPVRPAPRSSYRPNGPDWDHLPESKRDACAQMMANALQLQMAGKEFDAERLYRGVLQIAPNTHDALHMLGVIKLSYGDLGEAKKLIKEALALREEYAVIKRSLALVEGAINARHQRDIQVVCELGLPLLADGVLLPNGRENRVALADAPRPAQAANGTQVATHLISDFGDPVGEKEWFARRVATLLSPRKPLLWSIHKPVDGAQDSHRMRTIAAVDRDLPVGGVQILVGIDCDLEEWIEQAAPDRLLVFGLAASPGRYLEQLRHLNAKGAPPIELVFRSRAEATKFGRIGPVVAPPIDLSAQHGARDVLPPLRSAPLMLGMSASEERTVRGGDDGKLLRRLAAGACRLSILAPGRHRYELGGNRAVEFHSRREVPLQLFLARIDAFLHWVPDPWEEGCGLALFGAMARGLPVLCSRDSIYAEYIEHERSGLLFSNMTEVVAWVHRLGNDAEWARAIGDGARMRAAELFDATALATEYRALVEPAASELNH